MLRRPPRSTLDRSSAASDVYKRQIYASNGRVVLTGMGKSGLIARKIVATFNSTGTAAIYLHPTDALHGDLGMVRSEDVVILISKSGNTEEISNLLPMLKRLNVKLIAMCGNHESKLAQESNIFLNIAVKEEACPYDLAPTASTTCLLYTSPSPRDRTRSRMPSSA